MSRRVGPAKATRRARSVRWTDRARLDLESIGDYIARDNPTAAERWLGRLFARAKAAASHPFAGRRVSEIGRDDIREVLLRSYRIVYRVLDESIDILTVFEGHRSFPGGVADDALEA